MIPLEARDIAAAVGGELRRGDAGTVVEAVTTDSRQVPTGALFVALRGENADGHDFLLDAAEAGAVALLSERDLEDVAAALVLVDDTWSAIAELGADVRRRVDPLVVAITGSVGKTTTKDLTRAALGAGLETAAAQGSYNNELGVPLTLLAVEADTRALVVEIGARGVGHVAALTPLVEPDIGIVTAVAGVHLELFGDIDAIATAKGELVEALPAGGTAVLNGDDHRVAAMAGRTDASVLLYGLSDGSSGEEGQPGLDLVATSIHLDRLARPTFRALTPWGEVEATLPVAGRHQVGNALAALAAAGSGGVDPELAAAALSEAAVSAWRGEVSDVGGVVILNDAYNANPTSVTAAVEMLQSVERSGETWAVLGVMAEIGTSHDEEHRRTGREAVDRGVDHLVVVGEDARAMVAGASAVDGADVRYVADAAAALDELRPAVRPGDVVLVKASRVGGLEAVAAGLEDHLREQRP